MISFGPRLSIFLMILLLMLSAATGAAKAENEGRGLFKNDCAECHTLNADEPAKRGPHLEGLFSRRYGAVEGFPYRMVWKKADPVWTVESLDDYLVIHGRYDDAERGILIRYLQDATRL